MLAATQQEAAYSLNETVPLKITILNYLLRYLKWIPFPQVIQYPYSSYLYAYFTDYLLYHIFFKLNKQFLKVCHIYLVFLLLADVSQLL